MNVTQIVGNVKSFLPLQWPELRGFAPIGVLEYWSDGPGEKTFLFYHPTLQYSITPNIRYEAIAVKSLVIFPPWRDRNSDTFNYYRHISP